MPVGIERVNKNFYPPLDILSGFFCLTPNVVFIWEDKWYIAEAYFLCKRKKLKRYKDEPGQIEFTYLYIKSAFFFIRNNIFFT